MSSLSPRTLLNDSKQKVQWPDFWREQKRVKGIAGGCRSCQQYARVYPKLGIGFGMERRDGWKKNIEDGSLPLIAEVRGRQRQMIRFRNKREVRDQCLSEVGLWGWGLWSGIPCTAA